MRRLEAENASRRRIARSYRESLHGVGGIELAFHDRLGSESSAHHLAVAVLPPTADRAAVRDRLAAARIQTSVHYPPIHRFSAYHGYDGRPLPRDHGGPVRLLVPHLYFWKSAKWVTRLTLLDHDQQGFWEQNGYHDRGDPWLEQRYQGD